MTRRTPFALALAVTVGAAADARAGRRDDEDADDPLAAGSQIAIDLDGLSLDELFDIDVVTATKTARSADEVPAMIEVVTADQIRTRGYRHLGDLLNDLPDNHVDRTNWGIGEPVSQYVGFGFRFDTGQNILLLYNGQRLNAFLPGNRFGLEEYLLGNIDRVEVIRGPGSALYGANAFTTVVNLISADELAEGERPWARATVGGIATSGGTSVEGAWRTSLGTRGFFSGALRGAAEQGQALEIANTLFGDAVVRDAVRHAVDGEMFFRWDALRVYAKADHQLRNTVTGFNGVQPDDRSELSLMGYAYALGADYTHEVSPRLELRYAVGAHVDNWTEVGLIPLFAVNADGTGLALDADGQPYLDTVTVTRDGRPIETSFPIDGQGADTLTGDVEIQATVQYAGDNTIVFGVNGTYDTLLGAYRDTELQLVPFEIVPFDRLDDDANNWLFDTDAARVTGGAYGQIDYAVARRLFLTGGARFDAYGGTGLLDQRYNAFNPRAGAVWKDRTVGNVKALFGRATRIPNGFEALSSVTILGDPGNRPEQISTFQAAWERTFADRLAIGGGYFLSILDNHLTTDANIDDLEAAQGFIGQFVNVPGEHLRSQGIDAELDLRVRPAAISANFTQLFGTDDGAGNPIAYIPTTLANLNASLDLGWVVPNVGVNFRGGFTRSAADPRPVVPPYVLLTPTVAVRPPVPLELRVGARNALDLDVRYPSSSLDFPRHFPARRLELWADLSYTQSFGRVPAE